MILSWLAMLATAPFSLTPIAEHDLADMRGGFALPGGLNVAIAIQTDTRVDGSLLLRTVYRVDQAVPQLTVYAPESVRSEQPRADASAISPPVAGVTVTFDRQNGARIGPEMTPVSVINVVNAKQGSLGEAPRNTLPVDFSSGNDTVVVPSGRLALINNAAGQQVRLQTDQLDVSHLFGNVIGSVIANSGSDRAIDTATTVALDISGATPFNLGSSMLKIDTLVADTAGQLVPR